MVYFKKMFNAIVTPCQSMPQTSSRQCHRSRYIHYATAVTSVTVVIAVVVTVAEMVMVVVGSSNRGGVVAVACPVLPPILPSPAPLSTPLLNQSSTLALVQTLTPALASSLALTHLATSSLFPLTVPDDHKNFHPHHRQHDHLSPHRCR